MGDCHEKTLSMIEPPPRKKLKLSRGRPKISATSIVSYQTKKYLERQSQLVQVKFMCIQRDAAPLLPHEIVDIVARKFGTPMRDLFVLIQQHQVCFLERFDDPAEDSFIDMCDFAYQIKHFNLVHSAAAHKVSMQTMFMVYVQYLSTDMDATSFERVCDIIVGLLRMVLTLYSAGEVVPLSSFDHRDTQHPFERQFIDTLAGVMQENLHSLQMTMVCDVCKVEDL